MKKTILIMTALAILSVGKGYAQQWQPKNSNQSSETAVKDYTPSQAATSEEVLKMDDGVIVKYSFGDVDFRVDYDKKGIWIQTIRTYKEQKLPRHLGALIRQSYRDYAITLVEEIEKPGSANTFVIHLEGKTNWVNLRVYGDEMDEWQKYSKPAGEKSK